jgi:hypothetical protein
MVSRAGIPGVSRCRVREFYSRGGPSRRLGGSPRGAVRIAGRAGMAAPARTVTCRGGPPTVQRTVASTQTP